MRVILGDKADGIFGLKDLKGKVITIDYKNSELTLSDKLATDQAEGFTRIPIETDTNHPGRILFPIEVTVTPGKVISGKALLDIGSGQGLHFASKAAAKYGLDKIQDKVYFHHEHGGVGGESIKLRRAISCSSKVKPDIAQTIQARWQVMSILLS